MLWNSFDTGPEAAEPTLPVYVVVYRPEEGTAFIWPADEDGELPDMTGRYFAAVVAMPQPLLQYGSHTFTARTVIKELLDATKGEHSEYWDADDEAALGNLNIGYAMVSQDLGNYVAKAKATTVISSQWHFGE